MPARISLRVSYFLWNNADRIPELLDLLREHPEIEEIAFFTALTHPPLPLAELQKRASALAGIMPHFREIGLSAGINILSTIGHLDENPEGSLDEPWQRMVDEKGTVSQGTYCFSDERMRDYVREIYRALVDASPEFIWIDDDVRLEGHMPINFACFCPLCLARFGELTGGTWTRASLLAAFSEGPREERFDLRRKWIGYNRDYVTEILRFIRAVVDEAQPAMPLGFMTTGLAYSGSGYADWSGALLNEATAPGGAVKWRPGGGFYDDSVPTSLLSKIHSVGWQTAPLAANITDIQYEHENFPYQTLKKSRQLFVTEIAAAIGAGCTGAALNLMGVAPDPFDEFKPYFAATREAKAFFDRAVETFGRSACEGIAPPLSPDGFITLNADGEWPSGSPWGGAVSIDELSHIGLPFAYSAEGTKVTLLAGDSCLAFSSGELKQILAGGVVLDGAALGRLNEMGLQEYTGFAVKGTRERDSIEILSGDSLNGRYIGWSNDCRPSFWKETVYLLQPAPGARVLSEVKDFVEVNHGAASGVFENQLGGRVAVLGYYPWRMISTLAKSSQMKTLYRWLSRDTLPAYVDSYSKAALWCRRDADGNPALLLLNISIDTQDIVVRVRSEDAPDKLRVMRMDGTEATVASGESDGVYTAFEIKGVAPWQAVLLRV